jgi:acetylglutamate kinase
MSSFRPERVDESIKSNAIKSIQKKKLQSILDALKDKSTEEKIVAIREYLLSKKLPVKAILKETFMNQNRIAVHFTNVSYFFAI